MTELAGQTASPEYDAAAERLLASVESLRADRPLVGTVIGIAGESGSGKTVTALSLARAIERRGPRVLVLHQDDYFLRPPATNHEHRRGDLTSVGPPEVRMPLLAEHIAAFRARRQVVAPRVDYPGNRFLTRQLDFSAIDVLLVEGTYVLLLPQLDVRVFLEATHEDTRARRLTRARDIHEPFVDEVLRIEHAIIATQAGRADIVIDREFRSARRV